MHFVLCIIRFADHAHSLLFIPNHSFTSIYIHLDSFTFLHIPSHSFPFIGWCILCSVPHIVNLTAALSSFPEYVFLQNAYTVNFLYNILKKKKLLSFLRLKILNSYMNWYNRVRNWVLINRQLFFHKCYWFYRISLLTLYTFPKQNAANKKTDQGFIRVKMVEKNRAAKYSELCSGDLKIRE